MGNLTNLELLYLYDNRFSGALPASLGNLTNLERLLLSDNDLSGALPGSLVKLTNLKQLWLENTQLCAPLDAAFQAWLDGIEDKRGVVNCEPPANPDRAVLVALYQATDGDDWKDNTNWLSDRPLGEWFGVSTNADERVTNLRLNDNALAGALPSALGDLTRLQWFDLGRNQLSGRIPPELGDLTNLRVLSLYANQLSDALPPELGNLTNLQWLWLGYNELSGELPLSLVDLTNLTWLNLEATQLCAPLDAAFQAWLDGIDNKQGVVNCGDDEPSSTAIVLSVDPQAISEDGGPLEIVVTATLDGKTLPEDTIVLLSIGTAGTAIRDVDYRASFRRLVIPADAIAGSTVLVVAPIDDAEVEDDETIVLMGAVDGLMGDEVAIRIIDNDETLITPIPPDRAVLVALYEATNGANWTNNTNWLSDQPLGEWFGVTTDENGRVTRLRLHENRLSGALPSELGNLTNLTYLNLGDNALSGTIPSSLGNLTNLQQLGLFDNRLSGGLPLSLGNLTNLQELWLKGNASLEGPLPLSLVNLTNLRILRLEDTQLCVPLALQAWLGGIDTKQGVVNCGDDEPPSTAIVLSVDPQAISEDGGPVQVEVTATLDERALSEDTTVILSIGTAGTAIRDVDYRALFGLGRFVIPADETSGSTVLEVTPIDDAEVEDDETIVLIGAVDGLMGDEVAIRIIDNDETPRTPSTDPDRAVLVALYEATNGANWMNNTNWLSDQPLGEWFGVTTDENGRVTGLRLRENRLSGSLPSELGNLTNLQRLDLYNNALSGALPSSLGNLTNLTYLNLGDNALSGDLPRSLGNLTNLQQLGLFDNRLSGELPLSLGNLIQLEELWLKGNASLEGELPPSLVNLTNLRTLRLEDTQLCAPTDDVFQAWLDGIDTKRGVRDCYYGEPSTAIVLSVNPRTIREDAGETEITVTATLDERALSEDTTVILSIGTAGTATRDVDYGASFRRLVIPADETAGSTVLVVTPIDDAEVESDETIVLMGAVDGLRGDEVAITIIDDDETLDNPDRAVLVALYEATNGDNWTNNTNWLSDRPLGEWYGVTTNANGRVTHLELDRNVLSGSLPSSLGDLTHLQYLNLFDNALSGSLPSSLGNLTNLQVLWLAGNDFSGVLPLSLGNLTNLQQLSLAANQFSGELPSWLGTLTNLQDLRLQHNQFSGSLPSSLGNLTRLVRLYLHENKALLNPLPLSLVKLTNLQQLYLDNTQLCAPTDAAFQTWLGGIDDKSGVVNCEDGEPSTAIVLSVNPQTIREDEGEVPITVTATLDGRALSEDATVLLTISSESTAVRDVDYGAPLRWPVIPAGSIAGSTTIDIELIDDDRAEGDETILLVGEVEGLKWDAVEITIIDDDEAPDNPDRAALVALYEATNGANWTNNTNWLSDRPLGEWYGVGTDNNGRVAGLVLQDNGLSGSIPSSLGNLSSLHRVWLNGNELSGSIPSTLGNLSNLQQLSLHSNGLSGSIPSTLGNLSNLTGLWLNGNELSGSIPSSLGNLSNLQDLELNFNQLSGSIPSSLGNLSNLQDLKLYSNQLTGSIPSSLGNLSNLQNLALGYNQLTGSIPSTLGNLSNLQDLYLRSNQLSGSIPSSLGNLSSLQTLELSINSELSGPLPGSLIGLEDLNRLNIEDTGLCAPVDDAFQGWLGGILTKIGVVNCEDPEPSNPDRAVLVALYEATNGANWANNTNWLSDQPLGEWFGVTTDDGRVIELVLEDNALSGALPSALGNLTNLQKLNLYRNQLSGSIPSELGNLTNLQYLVLGPNQLSGSIPSELGNLTNLISLVLVSNQLSGSIPSELGNLTNLQYLWLGSNQLSGSLPSSLGNLTKLEYLELLQNDFSGELPSSLVNLTNLRLLDLRNTQLCAPPTDAAFQTWLDGIDNKYGVVTCPEYDDDGALRLVEGVEMKPLVFPEPTPEVFGGTPPYMYSVSGLPPGLSFDPETRTISGTPTEAGRYEVTVRLEDATGQSAERPIIVIVAPSGG